MFDDDDDSPGPTFPTLLLVLAITYTLGITMGLGMAKLWGFC